MTGGTLAMMTVGSVGYLGSAPATAEFGLASVFLYVLPAVVFLVPVSLVAAELASGWEGGVYNWVREGLSARMGLVAVWCQFSQTIFYYPALLAYVGSTLAYIADPTLAGNGIYTAAIIVVLFWSGVLVSSRGVGFVAELSSSGTVLGTLIPGAVLVVLAAVYLVQGHESAAPMNVHHLLPAWTGLASIVLVVNSFFTYAGIEINAVHVDELRDPGREYPRAMFLATLVVLAVFILPTLAISWVIPAHQISLTAGVMQAFNSLLRHFGLAFAVPVIAIALAVGALAGMMAWLDGPVRGAAATSDASRAICRPTSRRPNVRESSTNILTAQGVVITMIALLYAFIPTVSERILDLRRDGDAGVPDHVPADVHRRSQATASATGSRARLPRAGAWTAVHRLAAISSIVAFVIGFVAPSQLAHTSPVGYALLILAGILTIGILPPVLLLRFRKPTWKAPASPSRSSVP